MKRNRRHALGAVLAATALLTTGCLQGGDDDEGGGGEEKAQDVHRLGEVHPNANGWSRCGNCFFPSGLRRSVRARAVRAASMLVGRRRVHAK